MNDKIIEQWKRPIPQFKYQVKCCYNCKNWEKDITLMGDYAYNFCNQKKNIMTNFDGFCEKYKGTAKEENLIYNLPKEQKQELLEKYGN